ncbi:peptidylprolyl isomerase [Sphingopyxis sp. XHP0097]|uniref:Peptidylprolyl isomerase n=1 Tax=Sphingopyxis jiangsuensis TaxID=2871171 RepID=A0ABS7MB65_9SPHN|nr:MULTISPECIES: peptidylprolyl isomerase [Sphingopyxis]MBY4636047.1 peptidylprolyl isomerase [Sphingopyxis jiangsuensis]
MRQLLLAAAAVSLVLPVHAPLLADEAAPSPGQIVDAAPADDWIAIAPSDLLVMDLAADAIGNPRRVVIQLMPAPFSQGWIDNIRKLAAAHWWDGTSVNRVQDNYVVQWGDATEEKALPEGLATVPERKYEAPLEDDLQAALRAKLKSEEAELLAASRQPRDKTIRAIQWAIPRDPFAEETIVFRGWPIAVDRQDQSAWPVHCYAMVGVGRNLSPDTGTGAELYTVIGHAPRHLDRNIALVGRVISGIEHLSSLPRGTGALGFYEDAAQRVPIVSVRLASELTGGDRPHFEHLSTESDSFARYADARANRRDPFFIRPAGGADICNVPVPVRPVAAE